MQFAMPILSMFFTVSLATFGYLFQKFVEPWMFFVTVAAYIAAFVSGILIAKLFFGEDWAIVKTKNYSLTKENKKLHSDNAKLEDDNERLRKANDSLRLI